MCNNICVYVRQYVEMELWSEGYRHCNFYICYQILLQEFLLIYISLPSSHFRFWRLSMESVPLEVIGEEIGCKIEQGKMDICVYISAS